MSLNRILKCFTLARLVSIFSNCLLLYLVSSFTCCVSFDLPLFKINLSMENMLKREEGHYINEY